MIDEDLAEFLSSKLEFNYFLFIAIRAREKVCHTCQSIYTISEIKKIQWVLLTSLSPAQSTEQVIALPSEEKLWKINLVQILAKWLT